MPSTWQPDTCTGYPAKGCEFDIKTGKPIRLCSTHKAAGITDASTVEAKNREKNKAVVAAAPILGVGLAEVAWLIDDKQQVTILTGGVTNTKLLDTKTAVDLACGVGKVLVI